MKFSRRQFLKFTATTAAAFAPPRFTFASEYPTRAVHLIVGFAAGGVGDVLARLIGEQLSRRLGQPFVIENRPGAAGNVGTETVAHSIPDGHTVLHVGTNNAISAALYQKLNFNFLHDILPVGSTVRAPNVMEVTPSLPIRAVPEFIAYAKAHPDAISYASTGIGGLPHMAAELFKAMSGIQMQHVPYRGSAPALADLLGGRVQVMFDNLPASIGHIRSGKLRALAVTATSRSEVLPEVPRVADFVPGYEASGWYGLGVPKNTPLEIVEKLNKAINESLADPKIKLQIAEVGGTVFPGSPEDFGNLIASETEKWSQVVKFSGAKAD
jgi:tripartite-type tricarboxylate transporter receptor subunit TctC